jgi:CelD/BcsL family acetyltransferase involved in cellulose biosynthesis
VASIALPRPAEAPVPVAEAPTFQSPAITAIDWPCWAAPSMLEAWDALASAASEPNPFLESWYLLPSLRALDPGESVQILKFTLDGRLCGLLPVKREKDYYGKPFRLLANWTHPNCFLAAPLVARGMEEPFWRALFDWADGSGRHGLFLHLSGIPLDGTPDRALRRVLAEQHRAFGLVHREERALLASDVTPEAYYSASMSAKKRKELRRQLSRLCELGTVRFDRETDGQELEDWIGQFLRLEAAGWKGKAGTALTSQPDTEQLFRDALAGAARLGRLERLTLRLDGKPIAMLANFVTPPGMFSFKTTYDEAYSRYSPGVLLQCENLLVLDREDIAWSDSCASEGHPMIDHIWRERRAMGRYNIAIGGMLRRALFARLLKAELGRNPTGVSA